MNLSDISDTDITGLSEVRIFLFIAEREYRAVNTHECSWETCDLEGSMTVRIDNVGTFFL